MEEKLNLAKIKSWLDTKWIASSVLIVDRVSSTQDYIFHNLEALQEGTVVIAESQEEGRGRLGRRWHSPSGSGIYMSILLPQILGRNVNSPVSLFTSVVMAEFLFNTYQLPAKIRWPNDVIVDKLKIAGVLVEQKNSATVVGVGINVNNNSHQLVEGAVSIYLLTGEYQDRNKIIADFLNHYECGLQKWKKNGFQYLRRLWLSYTSLKGKCVRVELNSRFIDGVVEDLDEDCSLVIRNSHGYLLKLHISDVVRIR